MAIKSGLNDDQESFLDWLFRYDRGELGTAEPSSRRNWAETNNIAPSTVYGWEKTDAFKSAYRRKLGEATVSPSNLNRQLKRLEEAAFPDGGPVNSNALDKLLKIQNDYLPHKPLEEDAASVEDLSDDDLYNLIVDAAALRGVEVKIVGLAQPVA